jgi:hypothetical protein
MESGWRFLEGWQQSRLSNDRRASGSLASSNQCQSSRENDQFGASLFGPLEKSRTLDRFAFGSPSEHEIWATATFIRFHIVILSEAKRV